MEASQNAEIRQYLVDVCKFHTIFDDIEDFPVDQRTSLLSDPLWWSKSGKIC